MVLIVFATALTQELAPRTEFAIPLVHMTAGADEDGGPFKKVRVAIDGTKEYAVITKLHDMHVKNTRAGTERIHYQEAPDRAFIITPFEARHISRVVRSFIETLEIFEKDLTRKRWDRCLYLDAYFPRFLQRFYYLVSAARNSTHAMPRYSRIPDEEFEVSLNSPLSDRRIAMWQEQSDYVIKLRIVSKELAFQLERWNQKELTTGNRNLEVAYSAKAEEAYGLFVRMYFNLRPPPDIRLDGEHL